MQAVTTAGNHFLSAIYFTYTSSHLIKKKSTLQKFIANITNLSYSKNHYDEKKAKTAYRWDDMYVKRFKWTLNFGILEEYRKKIVDSVFLDYFSEEDVSNNLFLNKDQIEEIYNEGNYIGGHTHSHTNLGTLSENEQENEIRKCDNFISSYSRGGIKAFSYPFGKENNFNFMSINILKKYGYSHAFSNIQPKSKDEKFNENVYAIKRIDPKDI